MAMSLNRVQLIGNLTRDPEAKQTPTGKTVATFGVATNFTWKDQSGQQQSKVEFHNIVAWGRLAEICAQYLKKGMKIFVEGRLQTHEWQGEDGVKRQRTEIILENMIMLTSKGAMMGSGDGMNAPSRSNTGIRENTPTDVGVAENAPMVDPSAVTLDDLPF